MKKKIVWLILSCLMVAALVLASCAKEVTEESEDGHPDHPAYDVIAFETPVGHLPNAGHKRRERAYDGNESRQDDGLPAVLFVELMGALQVFLVQEPHVFSAKHFWSNVVSYPVVHCISHNSRNAEKDE